MATEHLVVNPRRGLLVVVTTTSLLLALLCYVMRMYVRIRILRYAWWDDYLISAAVLLVLLEYGFLIKAVQHGLGCNSSALSTQESENISNAAFWSLIWWVWAVSLIKISMAMMLLRFRRSRTWQWGMGIFVAFQFLAATANSIIRSFQWQAGKNESPAHRWDPSNLKFIVYFITAIFIASDILLSLLPLTFIFKIHRPLREKVLLAFLMGLGLFASAAAVIKLRLLFYNSGLKNDPLYGAVDPLLWTNIEQNIGLIAACIPPLRFLLDKFLTKLGWQWSKSQRVGVSTRGTVVNTRTQQGPSLKLSQIAIGHPDEYRQNLTHRSGFMSSNMDISTPEDDHVVLEHELVRYGVGVSSDTAKPAPTGIE